ncbi:thiamine diphosphokinase [bacterium]|nr:thiamine diphosphokinase [bacterium]
MTNALILLNGSPPSLKLLLNCWRNKDLKICADGAANYLFQYKMIPDVIIGDFDSISSEAINYYKAVEQHKIEDQSTTDSEKAVNFCIDKNVLNINVLGAFGDRLDHSLYNLGLIKCFSEKNVTLCFTSETEKVYSITQSTTFHAPIGSRISLIPIFGKVEKVSSFGLEWNLTDANLEFGNLCSVSNKISESPATIEFESGHLLLITENSIE